MIVDVAIYVNGLRNAPCPLQGAYLSCRDQGGFAWVGFYEPTEECVSVTGEFDLPKLAVEDAIKAPQRPKVERYCDLVFVVLKSARYMNSSRTVEFGEIHAFVGPDFIVTVCHGEASSLQDVRRTTENYLPVGGFREDGVETHQALLGTGIWVIEGLDLSRVRPGEHELICLPLNVEDGDGAPAQAILRR